jgi:phage tail-like protein
MADGVAIALLFHVTLDSVDVGMWTECTGLSATYEVQEYEEGGQNGFTHKLPGRLKFDNVKIKRGLDRDSEQVAKWFAAVSQSRDRSTASITAYNENLEAVAGWTLAEVVPVSWTGPSFSADGGKAAVEELELAHHGFV